MRHRVNFDKILCGCGCGEELLKYDDRGRPRKVIHGHNMIGKNNPNIGTHRPQPKGKKSKNYKRGFYIKTMRKNANGEKKQYRYILRPEHLHAQNGYVAEHRLVMEKYLGRYLEKNEHVHHDNGDTLDNRRCNLILTNRSEHASIHRKKDLENGILPFHDKDGKPVRKKCLTL